MNLLVTAWDSVYGKTIENFFKNDGFKINYDDSSGDSDKRNEKIEPAGGITEREREWQRFVYLDDEVGTAPPVDNDDIVNILVQDECSSDYEYQFSEEPVIVQGNALLHL